MHKLCNEWAWLWQGRTDSSGGKLQISTRYRYIGTENLSMKWHLWAPFFRRNFFVEDVCRPPPVRQPCKRLRTKFPAPLLRNIFPRHCELGRCWATFILPSRLRWAKLHNYFLVLIKTIALIQAWVRYVLYAVRHCLLWIRQPIYHKYIKSSQQTWFF